jgi:uncharacterized protein (DUF302 family)
MKYGFVAFAILIVTLGSTASAWALTPTGLINVESAHSVAATADRLERILSEKGMRVFLRLNHAEGAQTAGVALRPTELVIFGNPKVGSPMMAQQQTVGIDLPQKMLIWQDASGKVWLTYNDPDYVAARHGLPKDLAALQNVKKALAAFAEAAGAP